ncbi:hypothetical protein NDU88_004344 [Pleurodeles waltl]|uniref:Uncharacterized protein n=1 Tax=Pleurodeles waltl TaxID=8319 RepID=A0AAV7VIG5_PLEWA|nr:hypothetical protein NDU88_004344 [Pleurodeles waltl]
MVRHRWTDASQGNTMEQYIRPRCPCHNIWPDGRGAEMTLAYWRILRSLHMRSFLRPSGALGWLWRVGGFWEMRVAPVEYRQEKYENAKMPLQLLLVKPLHGQQHQLPPSLLQQHLMHVQEMVGFMLGSFFFSLLES